MKFEKMVADVTGVNIRSVKEGRGARSGLGDTGGAAGAGSQEGVSSYSGSKNKAEPVPSSLGFSAADTTAESGKRKSGGVWRKSGASAADKGEKKKGGMMGLGWLRGSKGKKGEVTAVPVGVDSVSHRTNVAA